MEKSIKNIILIADDYPSKEHQSFVFVEQLVNAMVDLGVNVTVIAPQSITRNIIRRIKPSPKTSTRITSKGNKYTLHRPYFISTGNHLRLLQPILSNIKKNGILNIIQGYKEVDAVYCHFWHNALPVYKYTAKNNIPLFVACGEGDDALENLNKDLSSKAHEDLHDAMTGVISVSSENKRKSIAYNLIDEKDVEVYPNCVNTDIFAPTDASELKKELGIEDDDFTIAFVGGFIHRKGSKRLSDAITSLNDKHIKSIFIGKPFANDCAEPDCSGIVFKGSVEHSDIPQYLNCADIFVLPTLKEGCCNAIVEALASCKPVISSNGSFNDDILNYNNSLRVDPMSINEIAVAIKTLKDSPAIRERMINHLKSYRVNYSIEGRAQNIINFINRQINKKH